MGEIKGRAVRGADRMCEWLEGDSTEIEWEPFERIARDFRLGNSGASTGGVGIFRGPFGMCYLIWSANCSCNSKHALTYSLSVPKN